MSDGYVRTQGASAALPPTAVVDRDPDIGQMERWSCLIVGGALLGWGLHRRGAGGLVAGLAGAGLMARGVARGDPLTHALRSSTSERKQAAERGWTSAAIVTRAVTINRPRRELYRYWRDFSNLPRFMESVRRIDMIDGQRTRWIVDGPAGRTVQWEAVVTLDEPDRRIGWVSEDGGDIRNAGWVDFTDAPGGRGTEVRAEIIYEPPAGRVGRAVAYLLQREPALQIRRDLRRFKALMETGELPTSEARG